MLWQRLQVMKRTHFPTNDDVSMHVCATLHWSKAYVNAYLRITTDSSDCGLGAFTCNGQCINGTGGVFPTGKDEQDVVSLVSPGSD